MSEEQADEGPKDEGPTIEERASHMGWKPQEEYKGDSENWTDAEAFVKKGEEELPILRANMRKLGTDYHATQNELKSIKASMNSFIDKAVESKLKAAEKKIEEGAVDGDIEKVKEGKEELKEAMKQPKPEATMPLETQQFMSDNSWYGTDKEKTEYATFLDGTSQGSSLTEHYANIAKKVDKHFAASPPKAPKVEGGGSKKV